MKKQINKLRLSETEKNFNESMRRLSVAEMHRSGTDIRKAELERIAMNAIILKGMAEAYYNFLVNPEGFKSPMDDFSGLMDAIDAEQDKETLKNTANLLIDFQQHMGAMEQINKLLQSVNELIDKLKNQGVYFDFPRFALELPTRDMAKFQLSGAIGFLDGIGLASEKLRK